MKRAKAQENSYERLFRELHDRKVRYLVVGGVALNLYNVNRFTVDVDLMIDFAEENVIRFVKAMDALGYCPRVPVNGEELANPRKREIWRKEKNAIVLSFDGQSSFLPAIDVFLSHPIDFEKAYRNRRTVRNGTSNVSLIALRDLMKLKKIAGRSKDIFDLERLKEEMEK